MAKFEDVDKRVDTALIPVLNTHLELLINVICKHPLIGNISTARPVNDTPTLPGRTAVRVDIFMNYNHPVARIDPQNLRVPIDWTPATAHSPIEVNTYINDEYQIAANAAGTPYPGGGVSKVTDVAD